MFDQFNACCCNNVFGIQVITLLDRHVISGSKQDCSAETQRKSCIECEKTTLTLSFQIKKCGLIEFERLHLPVWQGRVSMIFAHSMQMFLWISAEYYLLLAEVSDDHTCRVMIHSRQSHRASSLSSNALEYSWIGNWLQRCSKF